MSDFNIPDVFPLLRKGTGETPEDGGCLVQVAGYLNDGVSWTDETPCVHPVLRYIAIWANDDSPDSERQSLLSLVPRLIGTGLDTVWASMPDMLNIQDPLSHKILEAAEFEVKETHFGDEAGKLAYTLVRGSWFDRLKAALDAYDEFTGRTEPAPIPAEKWDDLLKAMSV